MRRYQPGEIVLLLFPFAGTRKAKRRPALVLLDTEDADIRSATQVGYAGESIG